MAEYGVTEQGFNLKRFDVILKEMQSELSDKLGFDVSQNPQSMLNSVFITPLADKLATLWEVAQDSYYAKFPATAEGINLDNACQYGSVFREGNRATKYVIHCRAVEGTPITKGSMIQSTANPPVQLTCAASVDASRSACNVIAIRPDQVLATTYTISINSSYNVSITATEEDTLADICGALVTAISAAVGSEYEVTISENQDFVLIKDNTLSRVNNVVLSSTLTTEYVVALVEYNTVEYGDIHCPYGSITSIVTNVPGPSNQHGQSGMFRISNLLDPVPGRLQQEDWEFRQSYLKKAYINSFGMTDSIDSYILDNVDGVISVRTYENYTDETDDYGRPPHSTETIVYGGEDTKIADAILQKKTGGIQTYGNTTISVVGTYGDVIDIKFSRPDTKYVWLKVVLTTDGGSLPDNYDATIRESIVEETASLAVGETLLIQTLINNAYDAVDGITFCRITAAVTSTPNDPPAAGDYQEQNLTATQREALSVAAERIEVSIA